MHPAIGNRESGRFQLYPVSNRRFPISSKPNGPPSRDGGPLKTPRYHPDSPARAGTLRSRCYGRTPVGGYPTLDHRRGSGASSGRAPALTNRRLSTEGPYYSPSTLLLLAPARRPAPDKAKTGEAEGSRTPDLLNAIEALSQLSYSPDRTQILPEAPSRGNKTASLAARYRTVGWLLHIRCQAGR